MMNCYLVYGNTCTCVCPCLDWNTNSDEESVPELQQVSKAALACFLKHTGLIQVALAAG